MKRSSEPTIARCSMTGRLALAVLVDVSAPRRPGIRSRPASCRTARCGRCASLQVVLDLRAVEGALARVVVAFDAGRAPQRALQRLLGLVPDLVGADALRRPVGDLAPRRPSKPKSL